MNAALPWGAFSRDIIATTAANLLLIATAMPSIAGDARGYVPAPPGTKRVLLHFRHSSGNNRYRSGDKAATDFNLDSNLQILRPLYCSSLASMPVSIQALILSGGTVVDGASVGNQFPRQFRPSRRSLPGSPEFRRRCRPAKSRDLTAKFRKIGDHQFPFDLSSCAAEDVFTLLAAYMIEFSDIVHQPFG
ncbi:hypothetical protein JWG42_07640 [Desulfoprunum benzoelyticum]|uniref:Uncharacterized protein n=1 Tax=Desulfoprunum benzoelyticum TaxID=1506996 RepID=A0A840USS5_9BACT|nr:hypothetical protein [Desulfoprunum benzoelyticum]MBB5348705.1 hypothetical protein [Desulfoprunum benzoelyticum]MBM9530017.1 hypothetical protein [Desulfoprunum benzoelyticum]